MDSIYGVEAIQVNTGERFFSRYFETIRAARNWAKWLRTQTFVSDVRIMRGGAGGEEVK